MNTQTFKLILIGDSGVGKSSIVSRYLKNINSGVPENIDTHSEEITVGAAYHSMNIDNVSLQIWDTAGQERYRSICPIYYRGASCCLCVFDISRKSSFKNVDVWIESFTQNVNVSDSNNILLIANKTDMANWEVSMDEINMKAKKLGYKVILTSIMNMVNFEEFRDYIIETCKKGNSENIKSMPNPDSGCMGSCNVF